MRASADSPACGSIEGAMKPIRFDIYQIALSWSLAATFLT
jgi:hypothetical protein